MLIYFIFLGVFNFISFWPKLFHSEIYMHEYSNQILSTKSLYWFKIFFDKKIVVYHHGHAIDMDKIVYNKIVFANKTTALIFNKHSIRYFNDLGFNFCLNLLSLLCFQSFHFFYCFFFTNRSKFKTYRRVPHIGL